MRRNTSACAVVNHILRALIAFTVLYAPMSSNPQEPTSPSAQLTSSQDFSKNPEIESRTRERDRLAHRVDFWNTVYVVSLVAALIIGGFSASSQLKTIRLSKNLVSIESEIDSEKDRLVLADLKGKDVNIEAAKKSAADATERSEQLRKENINLEADLLRLRTASEPRRLTGYQKDTLASLLRPHVPDGAAIVSAITDPESNDFADDFEQALKAAGWETERIRANVASRYGISAGVIPGGKERPGAKVLFDALLAIGIKPEEFLYKSGDKSIPGGFQSGYIYLVIEHKPQIRKAAK